MLGGSASGKPRSILAGGGCGPSSCGPKYLHMGIPWGLYAGSVKMMQGFCTWTLKVRRIIAFCAGLGGFGP